MQVPRDDIVDVNKVPALLAVRVAVARLEQPHATVAAKLIEVVKRHRGHPPLVRLAWAINVEVSEPYHWNTQRCQLAPDGLIEQKL